MRIAQVQRIEVEPDPRDQRDRDQHRDGETPEHALAVTDQEVVQRRHPRVAHLQRLQPGPGQHHQRRQQGQVQRQRDQHAQARDHAQFGNADVLGGQEGEEAQRHRRPGHGKRAADAARRPSERALDVGFDQPLGAEPHGHLDAEVDAETHEQRDERH